MFYKYGKGADKGAFAFFITGGIDYENFGDK